MRTINSLFLMFVLFLLRGHTNLVSERVVNLEKREAGFLAHLSGSGANLGTGAVAGSPQSPRSGVLLAADFEHCPATTRASRNDSSGIVGPGQFDVIDSHSEDVYCYSGPIVHSGSKAMMIKFTPPAGYTYDTNAGATKYVNNDTISTRGWVYISDNSISPLRTNGFLQRKLFYYWGGPKNSNGSYPLDGVLTSFETCNGSYANPCRVGFGAGTNPIELRMVWDCTQLSSAAGDRIDYKYHPSCDQSLDINAGTGFYLNFNTWYEVEWIIHLNMPGANDGYRKLWVNKNLVWQHLNENNRGTSSYKIAKITVGDQVDGNGVVSNYIDTRYWDDIVVSTTGPNP